MPPGLAGVLSLLLFYSTVGVGLFFICTGVYDKVQEWVGLLPRLYQQQLAPLFARLEADLTHLLSDAMAQNNWLRDLFAALGNGLEGLLEAFTGWMVGVISGFATALPQLLFALLVLIICSFYLAADWQTLVRFIKACLSRQRLQKLLALRQTGAKLLVGYAKAYGMLLALTFCELFVGFLLLGVPSALWLAVIIALLDILPVFGTGGILVPWGVLLLLQNNLPQGIGILVLYGVITLVRNLAEPKLLGKQTGLHPVVMLVLVFVGGGLFGFWGLLGLPLVASFIWQIWVTEQQKKVPLSEKAGG